MNIYGIIFSGRYVLEGLMFRRIPIAVPQNHCVAIMYDNHSEGVVREQEAKNL